MKLQPILLCFLFFLYVDSGKSGAQRDLPCNKARSRSKWHNLDTLFPMADENTEEFCTCKSRDSKDMESRTRKEQLKRCQILKCLPAKYSRKK
uniref:Uncharacterized protein n=1 Tax=Manihot esculenta TaxID=3983 RepID=A0A2C9UD47_MANES